MTSPSNSGVAFEGYEESILATAVRNGWMAIRDGEYIELSDGRSVVRHRLDGVAELAHYGWAALHLARWYAEQGYPDMVARLGGRS